MDAQKDISDVLSAVSLLLAVLAVLFGVWSSDIASALRIEPEHFRGDRGDQIDKVWATLRGKALWLFFGAFATLVVFGQRALGAIGAAWGCSASKACDYHDVTAAFVLAEAFLAFLTLVTGWQLVALLLKLKSLYKRDKA